MLWLGTYERDYPRNRVLIDGLAQIGVAVAECHAPLWEGREHKADGALAPARLAGLALTQLVVEEGWIGAALGPRRSGRLPVATRASVRAFE